jgi:metal-sulfur cluster biosynthetic enzyme
MTTGGLPEDSPANELSQSVAGITPDAAKMDEIAPKVIEALKTVYDPEIPVNVVDLGLIYRCDITEIDDGKKIDIDMTMTAPGCGMGDVLREDAVRAVRSVPGVDDVEVTIVFDPPWSMDRMPLEVRLELGLL